MPPDSSDQDTFIPLPVYMQIAELLVREIKAGRLVDGERLPTERAMAAQYGVSVATLRKALARLTDQGLLERRQGSGNYIRASGKDDSIYALFRLERPDGGGLPTTRLLSFATIPKPADLPAFGAGRTGHRFRRLRCLDAVPIALEEIWLDGSVAETIDPAQVSQSLYHFYQTSLGLWITRAEDWVGVAPVPDWRVDQFSLGPGAPAGFIERFGWSQEGARVEYSRTWFDPERARYVARLK